MKKMKPILPTSSYRQSSLHLDLSDPKLRRDFAYTYFKYNELCKAAGDLLHILRGDAYMLRQAEIETQISKDDISTQLEQIVAGKLPFDEATEAFATILNGFRKARHVREYTTSFLGGSKGQTKVEKESVQLAHKMHSIGIFPTEAIKSISPPPLLKYAALSAAGRRFRSWSTITEKKFAEKQTENKTIETLKKRIRFDESQEQWQAFEQWVEYATQFNFAPTPRFLRKKWSRIRKSLLRGEVPDTPYADEVFESLLNEYKILLEDIGRDYIRDFIQYRNEQRAFDRMKDYAAYREVSLHDSPCDMLLGNNYMQFELSSCGHSLWLHLTLLDSDKKEETIKYQIRVRPSGYFRNLRIIGSKNGKPPFDAEYTKGTKRARKYVHQVNEPSIIFDRDHLRKISTEDFLSGNIGTVSLKLQVTMQHPSPRAPYNVHDSAEGNIQDLSEAHGYFQSALSTDASERLPFVRHGLRLLGFDIGIDPPFAVSIWEVQEQRVDATSKELPGIGWLNRIAAFPLGETLCKATCAKMWELQFKTIPATASLISYYKRLRGGSQFKKFPLWAFEYVASIGIGSLDTRSTWQEVREVAARLVTHVNKQWKAIHHKRYRGGGINADTFKFLLLTDKVINLKKAWSRADQQPFKLGEKASPTFFSKHYKKLRDKKTDLLRKMADTIRNVAEEYGAHICIGEDLSTFKQSAANDSDKNGLLRLWSHQAMIGKIKQVLAAESIHLELVDPRNTSSIDPVTDEFGYRDKLVDKKHLYCIVDGVATVRHADIAAADNLVIRYATRFKNLVSLYCHKSCDLWVPEIGKRTMGGLQHLIGSDYCAFRENSDGSAEIVPLTKAKHEALLGKATNAQATFYRHGNRWFGWDAHLDILENIKIEFAKQHGLELSGDAEMTATARKMVSDCNTRSYENAQTA